jgi:hypothetical protein
MVPDWMEIMDAVIAVEMAEYGENPLMMIERRYA